MGHLAKRRYDLESGGPGPLGLEVPAIMVAGAAKEGIMLGSDLSKMLQGHGMLSPNNRRECTLGHNASESDLPLIADTIHDDVAILKVPSRWKLNVLVRHVNLNLMGQSCIIYRLVAVR